MNDLGEVAQIMLADLREHREHVAGVPTFTCWAMAGEDPHRYLGMRDRLLTSIGAAIGELRRAGWNVETRWLRSGDAACPSGAEQAAVLTIVNT